MTTSKNISQDIIIKARKLQALAERGVGGEATNAKAKLYELLYRHKLTESDLTDMKNETKISFTLTPDPELLNLAKGNPLMTQIIAQLWALTTIQTMESFTDCKCYKSMDSEQIVLLINCPASRLLEVQEAITQHTTTHIQQMFSASMLYFKKHHLFASSNTNEHLENKMVLI